MLETITFAPPRELLGDRAYAQIRRDIILCRLPPALALTEAGMAEHYRMGLAPIRSALSRLVQERLVNVVPRRGYTVAPITIQGIRDAFELRLLLEPAVARAAVGRVDPSKLRSFLSGPYGDESAARDLELLEENRSFHLCIAEAAGNERMTQILAALLDEMMRLLHFGLFSRRDLHRVPIDYDLQLQQHAALVEAIAEGDRDRAETIARSHVELARTSVMSAVHAGAIDPLA